MKRIAAVTAFILIVFFVACACAYAQSEAGYFTLFSRFFAAHPMAAALILPAAAAYYLLVLVLVNGV